MDVKNSILYGPLKEESLLKPTRWICYHDHPESKFTVLTESIIWSSTSHQERGYDELFQLPDSDHAGYLDSRKSTYGGIQFLSGDKLVSWSSKKQDCTSMSLAEPDYVSLSACCAQVLWLRTQLTDYGFHFDKIPMYLAQRQP
ncbi:hypothetical protein Tco_1202084 [Tanacetum coccineum]